jgi:hypothetical protein
MHEVKNPNNPVLQHRQYPLESTFTYLLVMQFEDFIPCSHSSKRLSVAKHLRVSYKFETSPYDSKLLEDLYPK